MSLARFSGMPTRLSSHYQHPTSKKQQKMQERYEGYTQLYINKDKPDTFLQFLISKMLSLRKKNKQDNTHHSARSPWFRNEYGQQSRNRHCVAFRTIGSLLPRPVDLGIDVSVLLHQRARAMDRLYVSTKMRQNSLRADLSANEIWAERFGPFWYRPSVPLEIGKVRKFTINVSR